MEKVIKRLNEMITNKSEKITPFDFTLDSRGVSLDVGLKDYTSVVSYLDIRMIGCSNIDRENEQSIIALDSLLSIARAWNKADNFIPDFSNGDQPKYFPLFKFSKGLKKFVTDNSAYCTSVYNSTASSTIICFRTQEIAEQFGEQNLDLWNAFLLNK